jgi:hypothetical protein
MTLDLHESAWARAVRQSISVYRSAAFGIGATLAEAIVVPISILFTAGSSRTEVQIVVPILAGALTLGLTLLGVFVIQLVAASVQQRNELRSRWTASTPGDQSLNPEIQLLNFARLGEEKAAEMEGQDEPTQQQRTEAEEWTKAVVQFLEAHLPAKGGEFLNAGRRWGADPANLRYRVADKAQALRQMATDLSGDSKER